MPTFPASKFCTGLLFAFTLILPGQSLAQQQPPEPCAAANYAETDYLVCSVDPQASDLRLFWQDDTANPYRTFSAVQESLDVSGKELVFAFNAGMYLDDFSPMGLYIEAGEEQIPLNQETRSGTGAAVPNFYKAPNGVFSIGSAGASILPTDTFATQRPNAEFATQSGPMLVIDGQLHPAFIENSTDRKRRSGVGVCANGQVHLAISDENVNFFDFALFFRDHLHCPNALFLDGGRGAGVYSPAMGRNDRSWHGGFGPMIGLVR